MTEGLTMTKENNYLSANKVWRKVITKCDNFFPLNTATRFHKLQEGLQGAMDLLQTAICVMKCDESIIINLRQYIPKLITDTSPELLFRLSTPPSISIPSELIDLRLRPLLSISISSRWRRLAYEATSGRSSKFSKKNMKKWRGWFISVNM